MIHTYLRMTEKQYDVGQWLMRPEGFQQFNVLFSVSNVWQAFYAVNLLNGGGGVSLTSMETLRLEEKE